MIVRRPTDMEAIELGIGRDTSFIVTSLGYGEPIFPVRARDAAALPALNFYAVITEGLFTDERALGIEALRNEFIDWRRGPGAATLRDPD